MKKYFEHKLPTDNIVVRQDETSTSDALEKISGLNYPVVRIKDYVIDYPNINNLTLKINSDLLPIVNISINDIGGDQRDNNFISRNDILTIAIGNLIDSAHHIIKNNYYITNADNAISGTYTLTGILDVPGLYVPVNRVFVNKSSVEVLKFIADEVGLGYISNIEESEDVMDWIQYQNSFDFIEFIKNRMWVSEDSKIEIFVDQFANLNVIDVVKASKDKYKATFITDLNGELLEEDQEFKASNFISGVDDLFASINNYTPINNSGFYSRRYPNTLNIDSLNLITKDLSELDISSGKETLKSHSSYTSFITDNVYDNYEASKIKNIYTNNFYDELKLNCTFDNYYSQLFMYMSLDIDIWNIPKTVSLNTQDESVTISEVDEVVEPKEKSQTYSKNEKSGTYMVIGLNIHYTFNPNEVNLVRQSLVVIKS